MRIAAPALAAAAPEAARARALLAVLLAVVASVTVSPAEPSMVLVEDWSRQTVGSRRLATS